MALFGRKKTIETTEVVPERPTLPSPPPLDEQGLRSVRDHRDYLLSLVEPLPPFGMHVIDALGLALCEDIAAPVPVPRDNLSTVAGVAVCAADVAPATEQSPIEIRMIEPGPALDPGEGSVVSTQGRLPSGADAVLPWSSTDRGEQVLRVFQPVRVGENVRPAGSDIADESLVAKAGQLVDDRIVAVLAAVGVDKVLARPRPRVVVLSQGADLVDPARRLTAEGQVHDTTGMMIAAAAKQTGSQVWRVLLPSNDFDELTEGLTDQLIRADLVLVTGGPADADSEGMREVLARVGACDFAEVAMRPSGSQGFAMVGDDNVPVVVLPSDPVAAHASFHTFVRPLLRRLAGAEVVDNPTLRAVTASLVRSPQGLTSICRAVVTDEGGRHRVEVLPPNHLEQLSGLARCNAVAVIEPDVELVPAGQPVVCWPLDRD